MSPKVYTRYAIPPKTERNDFIYNLYKSGMSARDMLEDEKVYERIAELSGYRLSIQRIQQILKRFRDQEKENVQK